MTREDVLDILEKVPAEDLTKTVFVLRGIYSITLDAVARAEDDYLVIRGREGGTNDEGRAFFLPYDEIQYLKMDRIASVNELKRFYGEKVADKIMEDKPADAKPADAKPADAKPADAKPAMDPAAIAKANLLARIRAVRSMTGSGSSS